MAKQPVQFTDTRRVKELIELMTANDLTEIELVEDKSRIALRRGAVVVAAAPASAAPTAHGATHAAAPMPPATPPAEDLKPIKSPMVGTFYSAANPESKAYVSIGSAVSEDTIVCIIEAMKVFNEIPAAVSGTVAKILVQNGQSVEFGQPLFLLKPN